jgi:SMC interacting uncharacterized protein involved in chromosome segregation
MLDYFGLDKYDPTLSVPMKSKTDVITPIEDLVSSDVLEFLKYKKVEIDSVLAAVGNERFWEYLVKKLEEHYPTRNYTRVINPTPDASQYYPNVVYSLESTLKSYINLILKDEASTVENELEEVEGFIKDINERRHNINGRYRTITNKDETLKEMDKKLTTEIQPIIDKLKRLTDELIEKKAQQKTERKHSGVDIVEVEGIGPTTARLLKEVGITTVMDLADANLDELTNILYGARAKAVEFKKAARKKLLDDAQTKDDK